MNFYTSKNNLILSAITWIMLIPILILSLIFLMIYPMKNLKPLLEFISKLPITGKVLTTILITIISVIIIFFLPACGSTRVVVRNGTESAETTIAVTTNNPTSVNASPNVTLDVSRNN